MTHEKSPLLDYDARLSQNWIEAALQFVDPEDEFLATFIAECMDSGAQGGFETEPSRTYPGGDGLPACEACGRYAQINIYFPAAFGIEEVTDILERKIREISYRFGHAGGRLLQCRYIENKEWASAWKGDFPAEKVTGRFWVIPPWQQPALPEQAIPIVLEPGLAFGTGKHITTQHCLLLLEEVAEQYGSLPGPVLDIGCGSAILAIAAYRLGADKVFGLDIDPDALSNAKCNLAHNDLSHEISLINGSIVCLRGEFALITANLDMANLLPYGKAICSLVKEDGFMILSGILADQKAEVVSFYQTLGGVLMAEKADPEEGWQTLLFRKVMG